MPDCPLISSLAWCEPGPVPDKLPPKRLRWCPWGPAAHTKAVTALCACLSLFTPLSVSKNAWNAHSCKITKWIKGPSTLFPGTDLPQLEVATGSLGLHEHFQQCLHTKPCAENPSNCLCLQQSLLWILPSCSIEAWDVNKTSGMAFTRQIHILPTCPQPLCLCSSFSKAHKHVWRPDSSQKRCWLMIVQTEGLT